MSLTPGGSCQFGGRPKRRRGQLSSAQEDTTLDNRSPSWLVRFDPILAVSAYGVQSLTLHDVHPVYSESVHFDQYVARLELGHWALTDVEVGSGSLGAFGDLVDQNSFHVGHIEWLMGWVGG